MAQNTASILLSGPEAPRKRRNEYHQGSCQSCHANHRCCDRHWGDGNAKCLHCRKLGIPCVKRERNSGPREPSSKNQVNDAGAPTSSELVHPDAVTHPFVIRGAIHPAEIPAGNPSSQDRRDRRDRQLRQRYSTSTTYNEPHDSEIIRGIAYANDLLPGILYEGVAAEAARNTMLCRVLRLVGASFTGADESRKGVLLDEAKLAYGIESDGPTLATVSAASLLAVWVSQLKPLFAENLLGKWFCLLCTHRHVADRMLITSDNAYGWLSSYNRREQLMNVPPHKIHQLLLEVWALVRCRTVSSVHP
ncbi:uncharacterized protein EI90DRAFT_2124211 [Cantharellus anzutake]|uniref:uncharacterized protein n=1 Tax=Cantharellus anzutake TaxID=1750568 RepID=UPI001904A80E|nr:uncharacterized protein EI90DRAFT_2124211 [Cantharellus anzutake]KAF8325580.1 hypothetical protein EI90DRAFT_2124211 [Cantharellus anzutake]